MTVIETHKIVKSLVPTVLVYKRRVYKISELDKKYYIKSYVVKTFKNKIYNLELDVPHPNCHPETKEFCLPVHLIGEDLNSKSSYLIESMLKTFNLDGCYFKPWNELRYIKN